MALSANESLRDAAVRNSVFVHRFAESEAREIVAILNSADADLVGIIRDRLEGIRARGFDPGPATTQRLRHLLDELRGTNAAIYNAARGQLSLDLGDLAKTAVQSLDDDIARVLGANLDLLKPAPSVLTSMVVSDPFQGQTMKGWFRDLEANRLQALRREINIGITQAQTNEEIVRRIAGTRARAYRDGVLDIHRRHAMTVTRTATIHTNARARDLLYEANADLVKEVQWVATLDGRTSDICMGLDGQVFPIGDGPRPPAHPNCRSTTTPVLKSWSDLSKKGAMKAGRGSTMVDELFRQQLAKQGFDAGEIARATMNTRASMSGQVADAMNYSDWLRRQPPRFVQEVLGRDKARLFLDGDVTLDRFVDIKTGRSFTLDELRVREREAWDAVFGKQQADEAADVAARLEEAYEGARREVLAHGAKTKREGYVAYRADTGEEFDRNMDGKSAAVEFTPKTVKAIADKDSRLVLHHNHPSDSSLSPQDLFMGAKYEGLEAVIAHGHAGSSYEATAFFRRMTLDDIRGIDKATKDAAFEWATNNNAPQGFLADNLNDLHYHIVNEALSAAGFFRYRAVLNADKAARLQNPKVRSLIDFMLKRATEEAASLFSMLNG